MKLFAEKPHLLRLGFSDECVIIHPDNLCDTGHLFGVKCVGSFIGSDEYVTNFLNLKLDSLHNKRKDISLIEDKQILHQILRLSSSGMVTHLQRTTPPSLLLGFLSEYDLLKKKLCSLVIGAHPSCSIWIQVCLNLADGGLGYHDVIRSRYAAYVAAIFQSSAALCRFDPQIFESGIPVISTLNDSLNACSQLSGLPNSLTFNDIVTLNASSVDFFY